MSKNHDCLGDQVSRKRAFFIEKIMYSDPPVPPTHIQFFGGQFSRHRRMRRRQRQSSEEGEAYAKSGAHARAANGDTGTAGSVPPARQTGETSQTGSEMAGTILPTGGGSAERLPQHAEQHTECNDEAPWGQVVLIAAICSGASALCFSNAIEAEFVFDDNGAIVENPDVVEAGGLWNKMADMARHDYWGSDMRLSSHKSFRPLTILR